MSNEPVLARDFDLTVNTGTVGSPIWTVIPGIQGITPGGSATTTDDGDYDTDGYAASTKTEISKSLSVALLYKEDDVTGAVPAGVQAIIDASNAIGAAGKKYFKYVSPGGNGYSARFNVQANWPGGDKVNNSTMTAELTMDGAPTEITP